MPGCRAGLEFLAALLAPPFRARVLGDHCPTMRYGAAQGRIRGLAPRAVLEDGLQHVASRGWTIERQLLPRRHNDEAHRAAARARLWAGRVDVGPAAQAGARWHLDVERWPHARGFYAPDPTDLEVPAHAQGAEGLP